MTVNFAPCSLHHPPKPGYAGHSPAQLLEIHDYRQGTDPDSFRLSLGDALHLLELDRSAVVVRVHIREGERLANAHKLALVETIKSSSRYPGTQAIILQTKRSSRAGKLMVQQPGKCYPWDCRWRQLIPKKALVVTPQLVRTAKR